MFVLVEDWVFWQITNLQNPPNPKMPRTLASIKTQSNPNFCHSSVVVNNGDLHKMRTLIASTANTTSTTVEHQKHAVEQTEIFQKQLCKITCSTSIFNHKKLHTTADALCKIMALYRGQPPMIL